MKRALVILLAWIAGAVVHAQQPLNILLITADDLGDQLGCYGDTVAKTPYLDRLATEGTRFTRAYVTQASCSPSRSSILTGLYPHQNGQLGLVNFNYSIHPGTPNVFGLLKKAGYRTGILGKLHVAPEDEFPFDTKELDPGPTREPDWVEKHAAEFFNAPGDAPFFLMLNLLDPHRPFVRQVESSPAHPLGPEDVQPFPFAPADTPAIREAIADFYNCVLRIDDIMGRVLEALRASGKAENTLVIFVSDHGPPFTRAKATCYEAGVRVPFIVHWPGAPAGQTSDALISTIDLMPTLLDAAGAPAPQGLPGKSLGPLLRGEKTEWRDSILTEYTAHGRNYYFPRRAVSDVRYQLIENLTPGRANLTVEIDGSPIWKAYRNGEPISDEARKMIEQAVNPPAFELYDLERDPHEAHNLADDPAAAETLRRMQAELLAWRKRTDDPALDPDNLEKLNAEHAPKP